MMKRINESTISRIVSEVITEAFKSPKLAQLTKQNGGLERYSNFGQRETPSVYKSGHYIPASELTDDMIGDEIPKDAYPSGENFVVFKNGKQYALKNLDDVPFVKTDHYWQETPTNQGREGIEDMSEFPDINDKRTPYSVGPLYAKVNGKYYRNQGTDKYGSGIGDTGNHDREENYEGSKTQHSAPYNALSVSRRASDARTRRDYIKKWRDGWYGTNYENSPYNQKNVLDSLKGWYESSPYRHRR